MSTKDKVIHSLSVPSLAKPVPYRGVLTLNYPHVQGPRGFCYEGRVDHDHDWPSEGWVSGEVRADGDGEVAGLDALVPEAARDAVRLEILEVMGTYGLLAHPEGTGTLRELRESVARNGESNGND